MADARFDRHGDWQPARHPGRKPGLGRGGAGPALGGHPSSRAAAAGPCIRRGRDAADAGPGRGDRAGGAGPAPGCPGRGGRPLRLGAGPAGEGGGLARAHPRPPLQRRALRPPGPVLGRHDAQPDAGAGRHPLPAGPRAWADPRAPGHLHPQQPGLESGRAHHVLRGLLAARHFGLRIRHRNGRCRPAAALRKHLQARLPRRVHRGRGGVPVERRVQRRPPGPLRPGRARGPGGAGAGAAADQLRLRRPGPRHAVRHDDEPGHDPLRAGGAAPGRGLAGA